MGVSGTRDGVRDRRTVWSAFLWLLPAFLALVAALGAIVVIAPIGWRLVVAGGLVIVGVAALLLFSDGVERGWGPSRRWVPGALHWLSASVVALAVAVVLGAAVPSILGLSLSLFWAIVCDIVIGLLAGGLTLLVSVVSASAGGWLAYRIRTIARPEDQGAKGRLFARPREGWSLRESLRIVALPVAGILLSALVEALFASDPSRTAAVAADTAVQEPSLATTVVLPLLAWFAGTAAVWRAFDRFWPEARPVHRRRRRATHASALAVGLAIVVGFGFAWLLDDLIQGSLTTSGRAVAGVSIQSVPPAQRAAYLADAFAPRFEIPPGEHWDPTTVDWYLAHSRLVTNTQFCTTAAGKGCRELICAAAAGTTCGPCDGPDPGTCAPDGGQPHAVYYRYLTAADTGTDQPAQAGHDWAVIQYWIFYRYDSLQTAIVTQWHQSDWEQVSVLVERQGSTVRPVEVAFSEHCYGAAVPATEVSWADGTHPVSYIGRGSHANYPTQNDLPIRQLQCFTRRPARYLGAAGLLFNPRVGGWAIELPITYLIGLRDATGHARTVADARPISMQATPSVASFHGSWGVDNNLQVEFGDVPTGSGPQSPEDQNPAKKPFAGMFCGQSWLKVAPTAATDWVCPR